MWIEVFYLGQDFIVSLEVEAVKGKTKVCSLIYSPLYPGVQDFSAVFPALASLAVLLGLLPS